MPRQTTPKYHLIINETQRDLLTRGLLLLLAGSNDGSLKHQEGEVEEADALREILQDPELDPEAINDCSL